MAEKKAAAKKETITDLLCALVAKTGEGRISLGTVIDIFERRSYAPLICVLALVLVSPIGGLPGATAVFGTLIALLGIESFFMARPWVPHFLRVRSLRGDDARRALEKIIPYVGRYEPFIRARWRWMTHRIWQRMAMLLIIVMALSSYALGLVPGGLILPGLAMAILSVALFHHDGLWMSIGLALGLAGLGLGFFLLV